MMILRDFLAIIIWCSFTEAKYPNYYKPVEVIDSGLDEDVGQPLLLTPYLQNNQIKEAREASLVHLNEFPDILSYSGFFTVDEAYKSHLFFWFVPSQQNYNEDPVLLWLQGKMQWNSTNKLVQNRIF